MHGHLYQNFTTNALIQQRENTKLDIRQSLYTSQVTHQPDTYLKYQ